MIHLTENDYTVSRWSGGTTTQAAIMPPDAVYGDRDFLWRISSASVETEESDFTALPDYDRWILTLEGVLVLSHDGEAPVRLAPYEVHAFDGGSATHALGRCTDFNLMLRKERSRGAVRVVSLSGGETAEVGVSDLPGADMPHCSLLIFCGSGEGTAEDSGQRIRFSAGESVLIPDAAAAVVKLTAAAGKFVIAEMQY